MNQMNQMNQMNTATRHEIKQRCTRRQRTHHHTQIVKSQRKNLIYMKITYLAWN